ncbi:unnamed protein product [Phyllotreta striolata]|uniref:Uncharacterized protein n=1 Tax=Phyllotreta striolata TaxID=444603 RepID=A0A9N9TCJ6_PHYSR|nr:unnamed protein product [Phyllotreta striolata]
MNKKCLKDDCETCDPSIFSTCTAKIYRR